MKIILSMHNIFFSLLLISINSIANSEQSYKFGIVPQSSSTNLIETWNPLIKKLESDCKCNVEFNTAPDIASFVKNVENKQYDLIYINPLDFVISAIPAEYHALVKEENRKLQGLLIVKKDSPITELSQLKGQKIAFPSPNSFAATILIEKLFEQNGIDIIPVYVKSHESVYLNISTGLTPAGGGVNRTFDGLSESEKSKLRILQKTVEVTPHPIAIQKRVGDKIKNLFLNTLIHLQDTPEGLKILENLNLKPLKNANDSDWQDVKLMSTKLKASH